MFDGIIDKYDFQSKKEMYMIEFVALCSQMMDRQISYPNTETEISDFTKKVLEKSSNITDRFNEDRRKVLRNRSIAL